MGAVESLLLAAGVVFVAELGDKTQLLVLAASLRGRAVPVLLGAVSAFLLLTVVAASVGTWLGDALPTAAVLVAGGVLFVALGVRAWLESREEREDQPGEAGDRGGEGAEDGAEDGAGAAGRVRAVGFGGAFALVLVGELGDKTQLATVGLAARGDPVATAVGAGLALAASAGLAVVAGRWLQSRLRPRLVARASAALFVALGLASIVLGVAW